MDHKRQNTIHMVLSHFTFCCFWEFLLSISVSLFSFSWLTRFCTVDSLQFVFEFLFSLILFTSWYWDLSFSFENQVLVKYFYRKINTILLLPVNHKSISKKEIRLDLQDYQFDNIDIFQLTKFRMTISISNKVNICFIFTCKIV